VTPKRYGRKRIQVDAHKIGMMHDKGALTNIRIFTQDQKPEQELKFKEDVGFKGKGYISSLNISWMEYEKKKRSLSFPGIKPKIDDLYFENEEEQTPIDLISDCQVKLNKDYYYMKDDAMNPVKRRPYATPMQYVEMKLPAL